MDPMRRAMTAYGQAADTLPPLQQIVMLYDGAIRRLREAKAAGEAGRIAQRATAVGKAAAIVDALQRCLDAERGGEIAANLDRIYTHLGFRMQQINMLGDLAICDEVAEQLAELRMAWAGLLNQGTLPGSPNASQPSAAEVEGGAPTGLAVQA